MAGNEMVGAQLSHAVVKREQMDFAHQRQQFERDDGIIFYFNGPVSQSVVEGARPSFRR